MSQDIINNRFLEESVFAIADGYCVINLSKNIVRGSIKVGRVPRPQELRTAWAWVNAFEATY